MHVSVRKLHATVTPIGPTPLVSLQLILLFFSLRILEFALESRDSNHGPRGPNDQKNLISLEIFDLDRNF